MTRGTARRMSAVTAGLTLWLTILALLAGSAAAAATTTFRDNFASVAYSGNDGSANWTGSWVEFGEADGAGSGKVRVQSDSRCAAGNCGYLSGSGATDAGIYRTADLVDATAATLTFSYRRARVGNDPAIARVSVSSNGGGSWSTIAAYTLDTSDASQVPVSIGISSWISSETSIRFRIESSPGQGGRLYFDNVQIAAEVPDPPTTTTTSQPPTTTEPPTTTTTTTQPPGPTTTTSTTTTQPPGPTTTTQPPVTTTLSPPPSTSIPTPDPTRPTTPPSPPPSTTLSPSPGTTSAPVALPVPTGGSVRPPFPIDPTAGASFLGVGTTIAISLDLESTAVDSDVSSLVQIALGQPIIVGESVVHAPNGAPTAGGLAYLWPGLAIIAILGVAALLRRPGFERHIK